jgi:hypothetical protein
MSPFAGKIRQLVIQYKQILKRHLSASGYTSKVKMLHIKRRELKHATDVDLFHLIDRILYDIDRGLANQSMTPSEYSGLDEFREHIKGTLRNYTLKDNEVVNSTQHASRAIVESIQLLNMPYNEKNSQKLKTNIALLRQLGSEEELNTLSTALHKLNTQMKTDFLPIIQFIENERHNCIH